MLVSTPDILNAIWSEGLGCHVFMPAQKRPGRAWVPSKPIRPPVEEVPPQQWGKDMYFTPMTFFSNEIRADSVAAGSVLYADIDKGEPMIIEPSILWETSPDSFQGVWFTKQIMPVAVQADLNKRLTYHIGADQGGWSAAKVLRVPGTLNFKRQYTDEVGLVVPKGRIESVELALRYDVRDLDALLPLVTGEVTHTDHPPIPDHKPSLSDLPMGIHAWMVSRYDDRSKRCYSVAREFAKRNLPIQMAWEYIWFAPFNKYTERPEVLWWTLERAYGEESDSRGSEPL